jgi:hypothetical protein
MNEIYIKYLYLEIYIFFLILNLTLGKGKVARIGQSFGTLSWSLSPRHYSIQFRSANMINWRHPGLVMNAIPLRYGA